jgi:hypothetical protein
MMPDIGASMADAARTRENEGPCICDGCDNNPYECCMNEADCLNTMAEAAAEERDDARRERDL